MNRHSNILKISPTTDYCKEFLNRIQNKLNKSEAANEVQQPAENRKDAMEIDDDIFFGVNVMNDDNEYQVKRIFELTNEDEKFILEVNILEIFPDKIYDFIYIYCQNCQKR
jgi:hypothetical protein